MSFRGILAALALTVLGAAAAFVAVRHPWLGSAELRDALKEQKVVVRRYLYDPWPYWGSYPYWWWYEERRTTVYTAPPQPQQPAPSSEPGPRAAVEVSLSVGLAPSGRTGPARVEPTSAGTVPAPAAPVRLNKHLIGR